MDLGFGSLRTKVTDGLKDILGGIQASASGGGGQSTSWSVSLGENRVMSGWALFVVLVVGLLLGAAVFGRRK